jgi:hypothetical protein
MSKTLQEVEKLLIKYIESSNKQKQKVARSATLTQIKGLCEVCKNILLGNLPVSSIQKDTLKKHRNKLRKFADRQDLFP